MLTTVIPTTENKPAVTVAKSDLARSGLTRSDAHTPRSTVPANIGLMEWRIANSYPLNPNWR